ncbi:hypothetical protein SKAU_G00205970 [Synaphobranchus kaupii]|uniref:Uncharacterized protein n=1 Tax=Synaphobranchus kaupii TaxID=118154 RepID=A0A9Q1IYN6_SYNKA|nr:hypothetical protein SKAU_G00205970 [Synaphobranchus kaupii]
MCDCKIKALRSALSIAVSQTDTSITAMQAPSGSHRTGPMPAAANYYQRAAMMRPGCWPLIWPGQLNISTREIKPGSWPGGEGALIHRVEVCWTSGCLSPFELGGCGSNRVRGGGARELFTAVDCFHLWPARRDWDASRSVPVVTFPALAH